MHPFPNYSHTKCPKCEKTQFELVKDTPGSPSGTNHNYYYLRCAECKTFLSAFDEAPVGELIKLIAAKLEIRY